MLDDIIINKAITSRSHWIHGLLHFMDEEDLIQEGKLLVIEVLGKHPDAERDYVLKAINNKYSTLLRDNLARSRCRERSLSYEEWERIEDGFEDTDNIEDKLNWNIDKQLIGQKLLELSNPTTTLVYDMIVNDGMGPKEICKELGIHRRSVYKKIKRIRRLIQ